MSECAPPMLTIGSFNHLSGVRHAFFSRRGGVSQGIYESLNCGPGSKDSRASVLENRRRAMAAMDLPDGELVTAYQIHSAEATVVDRAWAPGEGPRLDAMATSTPGLALGVLTADCAPVLFADQGAGVVGAAHAGWRGAFGGVLLSCIEAMESLGAQRQRIVAGIGPCIGKTSYEVGPEFPEPFLEQARDNGDFFTPAARAGHFMFDLKGYVARRLAALGLKDVQALPCDTCLEEDRFFSYRRGSKRGESDYGRLLSAIYIEP
ncbi:peptidoglycan editing factor PgeF [Ferruginivarius sediminum]